MWSLVLLLAVCTLCWMVLLFCYYYNNINLHSDMNAWDTLVCTSGHRKAAWHFRNISRPVSQQHQFRKSDDGVVSRIFSARVVSCCVGGGHRRDTYLLKIVCMFNVAASIIRTTSQPLGILRASEQLNIRRRHQSTNSGCISAGSCIEIQTFVFIIMFWGNPSTTRTLKLKCLWTTDASCVFVHAYCATLNSPPLCMRFPRIRRSHRYRE